jgi:hypothetical protein
MAMDRAKFEYLMEDLRSRPDRMRLVQRASIVAGVTVALLLVFLLTRGKPTPKPKLKVNTGDAADVMTQGVKDAFEYAKAAQAILDRNSKFSRVYFVPSAGTTTLKYGKVVVMGEMASEEDVAALQGELAKIGVTVPVEWQVSVQPK